MTTATQNVTLAIPKTILKKVKRLALEQDTSLSRMLTDTLIEIVERDDAYEQARKRQIALMEQGLALGTGGQATWTREDLHDRSL
jgi:predicted transcriptional regulator